MVVIKLDNPIFRGSEEIKEISLREPNIEDIEKLGFPYTITELDDTVPVFNGKAVTKWIVQLTGLPPSTVKKMSAHDYDTIRWKLLGFFLFGSQKETQMLEVQSQDED